MLAHRQTLLHLNALGPIRPDRRDKIDDTYTFARYTRSIRTPCHRSSSLSMAFGLISTHAKTQKFFNSIALASHVKPRTLLTQLRLRFERQKPIELDDKGGYVISDLFRSVFEYEPPAQRPSAVDILNHSFGFVPTLLQSYHKS